MQNDKTINLILNNQKGMSLIEILIALTLLALAGTFITGKILDQAEEGKQQATRIQIQAIAQRLKEYRRHCGLYPSTEQGLKALIEKPTVAPECPKYAPGGYIDGNKLPTDGWDTDFDYNSDGKTFKIISYGADKIEGGEGWDADLDSDQ